MKRTDIQQPSVLDLHCIQMIRSLQQDGGPDLLSKVIDSYIRDVSDMMVELHRAISAAESEKIRLIAHRLKSGSADLGASRLAELFQRLERCSSDQLDQAAHLLAEIETDFIEVRTALARLVAGEKAS